MRPVGSASQFLRELIAAHGGALPVERFMQAALYDPQYGYYTRRVRTIGRGGDFATSATLSGALGQAVAAWANAHRAEVMVGDHWHLIELGGGNGELAAQIARSLGWWTRRGWRHHIVEVSTTLRTEQKHRLAHIPNVSWHTEVWDALMDAGQHALIFSNEFVDAFPCVQLVRGESAGQWHEVCLSWPEGAEYPVEVLRAWEGPDAVVAAALSGVPEQRVEFHLAYQRWLTKWTPHWGGGRLLTIDYGGNTTEIYHRQPHGTLRAYFQHQRFTGPEVYQRFGHQELTADVNFTDLQAWGADAGLATARYETQADFLCRWLPRRALNCARDEPALAYLLDPSGAGSAFKVLDQVRPRR